MTTTNTTNEKMNRIAAGIAAELGITHAEASALLAFAMRNQSKDLLGSVRSLSKAGV